jgi:hypothetical protein
MYYTGMLNFQNKLINNNVELLRAMLESLLVCSLTHPLTVDYTIISAKPDDLFTTQEQKFQLCKYQVSVVHCLAICLPTYSIKYNT